jgi:hypothetical protein
VASCARSARFGAYVLLGLAGAALISIVTLAANLSTGATAVRALAGTMAGFAVGATIVSLLGTDHRLLWTLLPNRPSPSWTSCCRQYTVAVTQRRPDSEASPRRTQVTTLESPAVIARQRSSTNINGASYAGLVLAASRS